MHGELNLGNSVVLLVKPMGLGYSAHKLKQHTVYTGCYKTQNMPIRPVVGKYVEITDRGILKLQDYNILVGHIILMCSWYLD